MYGAVYLRYFGSTCFERFYYRRRRRDDAQRILLAVRVARLLLDVPFMFVVGVWRQRFLGNVRLLCFSGMFGCCDVFSGMFGCCDGRAVRRPGVLVVERLKEFSQFFSCILQQLLGSLGRKPRSVEMFAFQRGRGLTPESRPFVRMITSRADECQFWESGTVLLYKGIIIFRTFFD